MLFFKKLATNFYMKPFLKRIRRRGKPKLYYAKLSKNFAKPPLDYRGFLFLTIRRSWFQFKYTKSLFLYFLFLVNPLIIIPNQLLIEAVPVCSVLFYLTNWAGSFWHNIFRQFLPSLWSFPSFSLQYIFAHDFSLYFFFPFVWKIKKELFLKRNIDISSFAFDTPDFVTNDICDLVDLTTSKILPVTSSTWVQNINTPFFLLNQKFLSFFSQYSFCYSHICSPTTFLKFMAFKFCLPFSNMASLFFFKFFSFLRLWRFLNFRILQFQNITRFIFFTIIKKNG